MTRELLRRYHSDGSSNRLVSRRGLGEVVATFAVTSALDVLVRMVTASLPVRLALWLGVALVALAVIRTRRH